MYDNFEDWWKWREETAPWMKLRGLDEAIREIARQAWEAGTGSGWEDCYKSYGLGLD